MFFFFSIDIPTDVYVVLYDKLFTVEHRDNPDINH